MDVPGSDFGAVVDEAPSCAGNVEEIDAYEEQRVEQSSAELETERRNEFISALKETTDLKELIQRAKGTIFFCFLSVPSSDSLHIADHLQGAVQLLAHAGITTANEILHMTKSHICAKGRLTNENYQSLLQHASMPFLPQMFAASELREQQSVRGSQHFIYNQINMQLTRPHSCVFRLAVRSSTRT